MNDPFPESLQPEAIGFGAIRDVAPVFFALYPSADDLPRVLAWRQKACRQHGVPSVTLRPDEILHVSVAEVGVPRRLREPLEVALGLAAEGFSYRPFELTLHVLVGGFGRDGRALVALADAQKPFGLSASRGTIVPHLTLGYGDGLSAERRSIEPVSFHVEAVDLVVSNVGKSEHLHLARWVLQ